MNMALRIIGVVRSERVDPEHTPVQSALNVEERARVDVDSEFAEGLEGLEGFDYVWLLTWLHRPDRPRTPLALKQVPFLLRRMGSPVGVFATRGPRRVNPIGLSLVRLLEIRGSTVHFAGIDMVDGTPVLDIKPYVTRFDSPTGAARCGWFDDTELPLGATPHSLARSPESD